jgi:DNA polymerase I-like protein with 3'-5' exonuclease and polymerase domains
MQQDYRLDAYVALGRHAGLIPPEGTRATHAEVREIMKSCFLGIFYGMGTRSLAARVGGFEKAERLLAIHKRVYWRFWDWADAVVETAIKEGELRTTLGWRCHIGADPNRRSLRNFPIQAAGAEVLRLACCFATESGVHVCAPVHDALLIEAVDEALDDAVAITQQAMRRASELVLDGFALDTDVKIVRYPDHYHDKRGAALWTMVWEEVERSYTEVFRADRRRRPHGAR